MNRSSFWLRLCAISFVCLSAASAHAANCNPSHEIQFTDGSKGCLTDYPFASTVPWGYRNNLSALLQNTGAGASSSIALTARGSACPVVAGYASRRMNNYNFDANTLQSELDAEAVDSCRKSLDTSRTPDGKTCECEVAVLNGKARFPRSIFDALALHGQGSSLASGTQNPAAGRTSATELASNANCKYVHGIKFVDGASGCLTDYAFSKLTPSGFGVSIADAVNSAGVGTYMAIAISENDGVCPMVAGYASRQANNYFPISDEARTAVNNDAIAACKKSLQGRNNASGSPCGCDVVVNAGESKFKKYAFDARVSERSALADAIGRSKTATQPDKGVSNPNGAAQNQNSTARALPALTPAQQKAAETAAKKEAQAEARAQAAAKAKAQAQALAEAKAEAKAQALALSKLQGDALAEAKAEAKAQAKVQADALSEAKAQAAAQAKLQADALAEAKAEAAAQTKMQAEALAQVKAEAIAQAKSGGQKSKTTVQALVIGNGAYTRFGVLANPRNDAMAIATKFRSFGISVDLVLDANRGAIVDALNKFQANAIGKDVNILYYAGHSIQVSGINYLLPTDMQSDGITPGYVKLNAVSLNDALDYLPAKTRLVFLDACRDNPAARSLAMGRGSAIVGLAPVNVSAGTLIAYATKDGATAADGNGKNSPYTTALLQHLDAHLDISIVLRRVRQTVMAQTSNMQEPWEYGSLIGDELVLSSISKQR